MALHLTIQYEEGRQVGRSGSAEPNPYDFFDQYEFHYAWDIGKQKGRAEELTNQ